MREIRFRAWDKAKKEMRNDYVGKSGDGKGDWIIFFETMDKKGEIFNPYPRERFELIEFTGLKDRDGKEIYEGDILENRLGTGLIEWKDNGFWMKLIKCEDEEDKQFHWDFSMEEPNKVIGNIYINGDLLK